MSNKSDIRNWNFEGQELWRTTDPQFRDEINKALKGEIVKPNTIRNAIQLGNATKDGETYVLPTFRIGRENWCSVECFLAYSRFLAQRDAEIVEGRRTKEDSQ